MKSARRLPVLLGGTIAAVAVASVAHAASQSPFGIATPDSTGFYFGGPLGPLFAWVAVHQAHFYRALTSALASLREDKAGLWLLLGLSFAYGVFHAVGPGHGKAVISSYLLASGESARRGVILSFLAAMIQAASAIIIVAVGAIIFKVSATAMTFATDWVEIISYGAIALFGAWLLWSKIRGDHHHHHHHVVGEDEEHHDHAGHAHAHAAPALAGAAHAAPAAASPAPGHAAHAHFEAVGDSHLAHDHGHAQLGHTHWHDDDHAHDAHSHSEASHHGGHAHSHDDHGHPPAAGPAHTSAPPLRRRRGRLSAVLSVGIRPCSGAIIILVFALSQGLFAAGIAATLVMALGTGITVAALATLAVSAKGIALRLAGGNGGAVAWIGRGIEIAGAAAVLVLGLVLLGGALSYGLPGTG